MYGKIQRFSATVSANLPGVWRNWPASSPTRHGETRMPITVIAVRISANVAATRPTKARASSRLRAVETSAYTGMTADDIALIVPHQANIRIIEAACSRLKIPMERTAVVLQRMGNTSAASIPLALADSLDNGRVANGDLVLLVGFGAGMTAASAVLRGGGGTEPARLP